MSRDLELEQLRALVSAGHERTACPSADLLARAAAGDVDIGQRRALADHLATCASCSEEYRTAAALGPWARAVSSDLGVEAPQPRPAAAWRRTTLAYAATVLIAVGAAVALAIWALALRGENARLLAALSQQSDDAASQVAERGTAQQRAIAELEGRLAEAVTPSVNVPIVDLLPRDAVRGTASASPPRVPVGARYVTFVMTTAADPADRDHELEIVDAAGAVRWRGPGLRPNAERTFTAAVPRALLPLGACHVRLYERRNEGPRLVADYLVVVE